MLYEFLIANRAELIDRCRAKVMLRTPTTAPSVDMDHGIPALIEQLIEKLQEDKLHTSRPGNGALGPWAKSIKTDAEIHASATQHGAELLKKGFTVGQVVREYGDLCQAITGLAFERGSTIAVAEFKTLNCCLDNAIANAVTEFSYKRDAIEAVTGSRALDERLRNLAHELERHIGAATQAMSAIRAGNVGLSGATAAMLDYSLNELRVVVQRSIADAWALAEAPARNQLTALTSFIADVRLSMAAEMRTSKSNIRIGPVAEDLAIDVDCESLLSAVGQLLKNAFKFSNGHTDVSLNAYQAGDRILIDIEDRSGGIPPGMEKTMFLPSTLSDTALSRVGLRDCRQIVEDNNGVLSFRDIPGSGCVFTIDLPRRQLQQVPSAFSHERQYRRSENRPLSADHL